MAIINPVPSGVFTDGFGNRGYVPGVGDMGNHTGQDIAAPGGTPILAAQSGVVLNKWWDAFVGGAPAGGNMVSVRGDDGIEYRYAHMQAQSPLGIGARVTAGVTVVGYVGMTGAANGNHLHFEMLRNGVYIDPLPYLKSAPAGGGGSTLNLGDDFMKLVWSTDGTGWLATERGFHGLPNMQVYSLFFRLINSNQSRTPDTKAVPQVASKSAGKPDTFLKAEIDIMAAQLRLIKTADSVAATIDPKKLQSAIADALKSAKITAETEVSAEALAEVMNDVVVPRVTAAILKGAGEKLSA